MTTGSGSLSHELTGLTGGTQFDVQVRAVAGSGEGPWSSAGSATPLGPALEPTDFNGDGRTDFADFFLFADAYGSTDPRFEPRRQWEGGFRGFLQVCGCVRFVAYLIQKPGLTWMHRMDRIGAKKRD